MASMTASKPETTSKTKRGFPHRCPLCGAEETIKINLGDVATFECGECSEEFGPDAIRAMIGQWQAALAWLATAPARND
jgi:hypothetical protein